MPVQPGSVLGAYEVLAPLGAGGMGEVWRARHVRLGREVALKVLPERVVTDPTALARFEREARAVAALSHPNVLAIHDFGDSEGVPYAAMELLEGQTLRERAAGGPLSWREVVELGVALCDGLAAAHGKGIVHRDLKPENVFLTRDGVLKILDFGLAVWMPATAGLDSVARTADAVTQPGMLVGTVAYMSPEQVRGEVADARSDLFALGGILYELLAGVRCFARRTTAETLAAVLGEEPRPVQRLHLGLPAEVGETVHRCLEKDRARRFQTARDVAVALRTPASAAAAPPVVPARGEPIASLAVLPFASAGSDPDTEYLADGVTENLINVFSRLRGLRVVPRTTAFRFRGREMDPEAVGRELNVRAILTGKVVQRGDTLTVQAELVDVAHGAQLWGERYRRRLADLFDVEEELAREIAGRLEVHLTGQGSQRIEQRRRVDCEAYRLYLEGRYHWNKRTPQGMEQALEIFEQVIARDPDFALAHAGIADCQSQLSHFGWQSPSSSFPRAEAAARKALEIEPELAEARAALAHTSACYRWDFAAAEAGFRSALQLDPGYATGHYWYAFSVLTPLGRFEEAAREMDRALELEPLSLAIRTYQGTVSYLARRYELAIGQARSALELEPRFPQALWCFAMSLAMQGRVEEALVEMRKAHDVSPFSHWVLGGLGHLLALAGRHEEARAVLVRMEERSRTHYVSPYLMAYVHAGLGDGEAALARLEQAVGERADLLLFAKVDPVLDSLRPEPLFGDVMRRVGLLS